jgi:Family of unknown function (DUF6492)
MVLENKKIAFVTPSYFGDFERCKLLTESAARFLPKGSEHILIIDGRDIDLFKPLENDVVRIVKSETLTPWWIFCVPGLKKWRVSLGSMPVRNWIYQQFLKIAAIDATDADVLVFMDSDVTLTRALPESYIIRDNRVRLQRVDFRSDEHTKWIRVASDLLGVAETPPGNYNYIGNFIAWTRPNILEMIERIRTVASGNHFNAIANKVHFSEYMTYGVYVDFVKGLEQSGHFHDSSPDLNLCWGHDLSTPEGVNAFFESMQPEHFGVMIHSKDSIPVSSYRYHIEKLWDMAAEQK